MVFQVFKDERGSLIPIEFSAIPFVPVRAFVVSGVPIGTWRGGHAHYITKQYIICVAGQIEYSLDFGKREAIGILNPGEGVLIDNLVWDRQQFMTSDSVLLVLCNTSYNQKDYITDYNHFIKMAV